MQTFTAAVLHEAQKEKIESTIAERAREGSIRNLCINRYFDATPMIVNFGALQCEIAPWASYMARDL
jgi:hypothetical protein